MEISVFFAKLLGPYCVIVALGLLFNLKKYQKLMEDFFNNAAVVYLGGVMALLFGLLIVLFHNVWVANWAVIITIIGWKGIIKGALLIISPNILARVTEAYQKNPVLLGIHSLVILALGAALTILGYFAG